MATAFLNSYGKKTRAGNEKTAQIPVGILAAAAADLLLHMFLRHICTSRAFFGFRRNAAVFRLDRDCFKFPQE